MKKNIHTILEITDTHVKVAQSQPVKSKRMITSCEVRPIRMPTDDEIVRLVNNLLSSQKASGDDLTVIISRKFVILKQLRLPSIQEVEIRKILSLQLAAHIPYPLTDVVYDFQVLHKEDSGYSKILVFVVHKDVIDRTLKIIQKSGFSASRLAVSSEGIKEWFSYQKKEHSSSVREPVLILNIDFNQTEIVFYDAEKLVFSRSINAGAKDLTDEQLSSFVQQIQLSIKSYTKETMGPEVKNILIVSSMPQIVHLQKKLEQEFQMPIFVKDIYENLTSLKDSVLSGLKNEPGVGITAIAGFSLSTSSAVLNLIPKDLQTSRVNWKQRIKLVKTGILITIFLLSAFGVLGVEIYRHSRFLQAYQNKISSIKKEYEKAQAKISLIDVLRKDLDDRLFVPDLLTNLYQLTPAEISFRQIELNESGLLTLQGFATNNSSVNSFQAGLVKSPLFKEVNLQFATQRKIFNMDVTDFQITTRVRGETKP